MVRFGADDDLRGAEIVGADMSGARIRFTNLPDVDVRQSSLPRAVMRGVDLTGADIDGMIDGLVINGVEVATLVEAELDRSWPGRALRTARHVAGQHTSWQAVQQMWERTLARVAAMPAGTADVSVDGEWSLAQTLRHLVLATDGWLRFGVQENDDAFHPIGVPFSEYDEDAPDVGIDMATAPSWTEVLEVRADRVAQVEAFFATATDEELAATARRLPPWEPDDRTMPVWRCLGVILDEEWEHLRFAVRDLDALEAGRAETSP
jgi:uncharacterized damage-inducible protein DinB